MSCYMYYNFLDQHNNNNNNNNIYLKSSIQTSSIDIYDIYVFL